MFFLIHPLCATISNPIFNMPLSKLYTNSLMSSLNARTGTKFTMGHPMTLGNAQPAEITFRNRAEVCRAILDLFEYAYVLSYVRFICTSSCISWLINPFPNLRRTSMIRTSTIYTGNIRQEVLRFDTRNTPAAYRYPTTPRNEEVYISRW